MIHCFKFASNILFTTWKLSSKDLPCSCRAILAHLLEKVLTAEGAMGHTGNNGNGKCDILPLFIWSGNLLVFCWADQHFRKTVVLSSNRKHKCKTRVCVYLEAAKGPLFGETSGKLNFFSCKTGHGRILPGNEFHFLLTWRVLIIIIWS